MIAKIRTQMRMQVQTVASETQGRKGWEGEGEPNPDGRGKRDTPRKGEKSQETELDLAKRCLGGAGQQREQ